jgi:phosphoserine phosphatase RsbU/P
VAGAGHPPPLVVRAATAAVEELGLPGTLLGPFAREARFEDISTVLAPGDALVLYTDGVTEARRDGEIFGPERLERLLGARAGADAHAIADAVESGIERFGGAPDDDVALLVVSLVGVQARVSQ